MSQESKLEYYPEAVDGDTESNGWGVAFFKPPAWANQWTLVVFYDKEDHNRKYDCMEQYMMAAKARLFPGNEQVLQEIMNTIDGKKLKALGGKIQNFDQKIWDRECDLIVERGNWFKFSQNPSYTQKLLDTNGKVLIEASPWDKRWGVGLNIKQVMRYATARDLFSATESGGNRLGYALMKVRNRIWSLRVKEARMKFSEFKNSTTEVQLPGDTQLCSIAGRDILAFLNENKDNIPLWKTNFPFIIEMDLCCGNSNFISDHIDNKSRKMSQFMTEKLWIQANLLAWGEVILVVVLSNDLSYAQEIKDYATMSNLIEKYPNFTILFTHTK